MQIYHLVDYKTTDYEYSYHKDSTSRFHNVFLYDCGGNISETTIILYLDVLYNHYKEVNPFILGLILNALFQDKINAPLGLVLF